MGPIFFLQLLRAGAIQPVSKQPIMCCHYIKLHYFVKYLLLLHTYAPLFIDAYRPQAYNDTTSGWTHVEGGGKHAAYS